MNSEVISIKIDPLTKKQAQSAASALGLSLSSILKGFLKQFIRTKTVTFTAHDDEIPNAYFKKAIREARADRKSGKASPIFTNIEDDLKWLKKQGI